MLGHIHLNKMNSEGSEDEVTLDEQVENLTGTLATAIDTENYPEIFRSRSKQVINKLAKSFPAIKAYWSRSKWEDLKENQRILCHSAWKNVDDNTRLCPYQEFEAARKAKVAAAVSTSVSLDAPPPLPVNQNTKKNDKARLLHLLRDPTYCTTWTLAHQVMNRAELDDCNRLGSSGPWTPFRLFGYIPKHTVDF